MQNKMSEKGNNLNTIQMFQSFGIWKLLTNWVAIPYCLQNKIKIGLR